MGVIGKYDILVMFHSKRFIQETMGAQISVGKVSDYRKHIFAEKRSFQNFSINSKLLMLAVY